MKCFYALLCGICLAGLGCANPSSQTSSPDPKPEETLLSRLPLGIIGQIEPVVVYPAKIVMEARIDTGATTSSIDARNVKVFERDGKRWVRFTLIDRRTKKQHKMKMPLRRRVRILEQEGEKQRRPVVEMTIGFGRLVLKRQFTLVDRRDFNFPVLIGRNVLQGKAIVDVSQANTLKPEVAHDR